MPVLNKSPSCSRWLLLTKCLVSKVSKTAREYAHKYGTSQTPPSRIDQGEHACSAARSCSKCHDRKKKPWTNKQKTPFEPPVIKAVCTGLSLSPREGGREDRMNLLVQEIKKPVQSSEKQPTVCRLLLSGYQLTWWMPYSDLVTIENA